MLKNGNRKDILSHMAFHSTVAATEKDSVSSSSSSGSKFKSFNDDRKY